MIRIRNILNGDIRTKWRQDYFDAGFGPFVPFGALGISPVVQANFAGSPADWTTLDTVSSMPTGGSISRAGQAMLYDSTGKLTYAPNNLLLNSATLSTQSVTTTAINYILSFSGTGSVALSGAYTGNLAGTGVADRVYLKFTSTAASLTLTVTGSVTSAQLEAVTYQTTPSTYVATTSAAYYGPRFDYDPSTLAAKGLLIEGTRTNLLNFSQSFATSGGAQNNWADTNITRNSTNNTSPDGTGNALRVTASAANGTIISSAAIGTSAQRVLSVWLRRVTGAGNIQYTLDNGTNWTTQAITSTWTRYSFAATTADQRVGFRIVTSGDAIEIWGVQLEAAAFSSSYVFTGSSTVTRAAETFAITGYSSNLINATYIDEQTGVNSMQPYNAGVAPSPSFAWLTALRVYTNAYAGNIATPSWLSFSRTGNAMVTDSTGKLTYAPNNLLLNTATLSTQTVTTGIIAGRDVILSFKGTGSVAISGGYTGTLAGTGASTLVSLKFTTTTASLTFTVTGTVTEAQLERVTYETQPSQYVATTSSQYFGPRYDFDASTVPATPRGLLIEESRANLITYSEQFDNAAWTKLNATISANAVVSPDGTTTADKLVENTAASTSHYMYGVYTGGASGTTYTYSVYAKAGERSWLYIILRGVGAWSTPALVYFNLANGTVGTVAAGVTANIQSVGNGWYRISATRLATGTGNAEVGQGAATADNGVNYTGDGVSGVYLWGAQLEAGSFATSYIPTTSASVTRAADVAQLTGSALTVATGSTASIITESQSFGGGGLAYASDDAGAATYNKHMVFNLTYGRVLDGGVIQATYNWTPSISSGNINRMAMAYAINNFAFVANNGTVGTDTSGTVPTLTQAWIGRYRDGAALNGWARSFALYNQRLPDAILKQKSSVGAPY